MRFRFLATLVIALAVAGGFPTITLAAIGDVPASGLVGHWNFDENTGTTAADSSGNGYAATLVNGPTWVSGIAGSAVNFATTTGSSNNYISFPAGLQTTNFPTSGTLSFWIKGTFSTQATGRNIFDAFSTTRNHIYISTNTGKLQIVLQDSTGYLNQQGQVIYAPVSQVYVPVSDNTWTNIVVAWDATNGMAYIYADGVLQIKFFWGAFNPTWTPSGQLFQLNATSSGAVSAESIDDFSLYNRPLSAAEIASIYAGTAAPTADTSAPSAPANVIADALSPTAVAIGWQASTDDVSVNGYVIYRGGVPVGYASSTALSFINTSLATSSSYTYTVRAFDTSGNQSLASNSAAVTTLAPPILFRTGFEEDTPVDYAGIGGWTRSAQNPASIVVSTEQARAGTKSIKFDFDFNDWGSSTAFDRAQVDQNPRVTQPTGQTFWTAISTFIPTTYQDDLASNGEILWQFHGVTNGPGSTGSPPFALYLYGDTLNLNVKGATSTVYTAGNSPTGFAIATLPFDQDKGKWIDWVIESNFNYTNGFIKVWKNGVKVADYAGPTTYHVSGQTTETGPWFNFGIYKWFWGSSATQVSNRTAYFDEIRQADSTATCSDVSPTDAASCSADTAIYTVTDNGPALTSVGIASNNASTTVAKVGDVVTLSFTSNQNSLITPSVTIAGRTATVVAGASYTWTASTTIQTGDTEGSIAFSATVGNSNASGTTTVAGLVSGSDVVVDNTSPVITLNGVSSDSVYVTNVYTDPGASALDAHDGTVAVTAVSSVNTSVSGSYDITYTATDAAGNSASATRSVTVKKLDPGPPVGLVSFPVMQPRAQMIYPDGRAVYLDQAGTSSTSSSSTAIPFQFTRSLQVRDRNPDVRRLQQFLNTHGYLLASKGDGSPGNETDFFGVLTYRALIRFQSARPDEILKPSGLTAGTGFFGPNTRAYLNTLRN